MTCHCTFAWPHGCPSQVESATEGHPSAPLRPKRWASREGARPSPRHLPARPQPPPCLLPVACFCCLIQTSSTTPGASHSNYVLFLMTNALLQKLMSAALLNLLGWLSFTCSSQQSKLSHHHQETSFFPLVLASHQSAPTNSVLFFIRALVRCFLLVSLGAPA